ncbi:fibrous sheath CABYR-binding protein-like isoform X2 [Xyrichtys novacula]|uniref:Fibrous sheath CABYR-binding protein-like isoform X2 n=1 Tax=Xyrichtys novacula TaxID=13765 RepID=A0AAV1EV00_XYRNO|nr:fibrous sheath CABYR-binding protein-like isoform X2 [Xyrichtys novacula]
MAFVEGSRGIYRPIRVMFETPIYKEAKQICWNPPPYKVKVALMVELLQLQQNNQLPAELTAESMANLMVEESKNSLRVQLWEFELQGFDKDVQPLLELVWEVNTSLLKRDVEFEARKLLDSPYSIPPSYQHPKIRSKAQEYAKILVEQLQRGPVCQSLSPREVVIELVPKVLQVLWKPKRSIAREMPSEQLSEMAVGVTKAVLDRVSDSLSPLHEATFSQSIRDNMVQAIEAKVRQMFPPDHLRRKVNCFEVEVLDIITSVSAESVCQLFEHQSQTVDQELANISQTLSAAPPVTDSVLPRSKNEEPNSELDPAEQTPYSHEALPAVATAPVSVLEGKDMEEESIRDPEPALGKPPTLFEPETEDTVSNQEPGQEAEPAKDDSPPSPAVCPDEPSITSQAISPEPSPSSESVEAHLPSVTLPAELPVLVSNLEGVNKIEESETKDEPPVLVLDLEGVDKIEEPVTEDDPTTQTLMVPTPSPPVITPTEASITAAVSEDEIVHEQSTTEPDLQTPNETVQVQVKTSRMRRILRWFRRICCCCCKLPED